MGRRRYTAMLALVGLAFVACAQTAEGPEEGGDPGELRSVTFGVSVEFISPPQSTYTSVPLTLGYWEDEGLDVEVLGFPGGAATGQAIDAGRIDAGIANTVSLISAAAAGKDFRSYFTQMTDWYFIPQAPQDSDIQEISDLEGARVGVASLESGAVPTVRAMLAMEGLDPEADVEFLPVGVGAEAAEALRAEKIDVIALWNSAYPQIEALGIPLRPVTNEFFEQLGYQETVFATPAAFEEQREMLVGLARGIAKGMVFAEANPEAAVRIHWDQYPESKPSGVPDDEALEVAVQSLQVHQEGSQPVDGVWGLATRDQIRDVIQMLVESGQIEEPQDIDALIDLMWTEEFLEEINDFDAEAVTQEAEDYQLDE